MAPAVSQPIVPEFPVFPGARWKRRAKDFLDLRQSQRDRCRRRSQQEILQWAIFGHRHFRANSTRQTQCASYPPERKGNRQCTHARLSDDTSPTKSGLACRRRRSCRPASCGISRLARAWRRSFSPLPKSSSAYRRTGKRGLLSRSSAPRGILSESRACTIVERKHRCRHR